MNTKFTLLHETLPGASRACCSLSSMSLVLRKPEFMTNNPYPSCSAYNNAVIGDKPLDDYLLLLYYTFFIIIILCCRRLFSAFLHIHFVIIITLLLHYIFLLLLPLLSSFGFVVCIFVCEFFATRILHNCLSRREIQLNLVQFWRVNLKARDRSDRHSNVYLGLW